MPAATVLFTDIVGFSKKPTSEQKRLVEALTSEVRDGLRLRLPISYLNTIPKILALPTGDGCALAFLHSPTQCWNRATILSLILRLHQWAYNNSTTSNSVSLRIGVHVGAVEIILDVNGNPNICGDTINYSQRVMDAASPRQTLFSDTAFREYFGTESPTCVTPPFSNKLKAEFCGPIEVYAKHNLQILVYKLVLKPAQPHCSNDDPIAKHLMLVTLTPLPKEIVGTFSEQIAKATHIAFVQLTGDRFLDNFKNGKIKFSNTLKRFWVFMPDPKIYAKLNLTKPQASAQLVTKCVLGWKKLFAVLGARFPLADFKLGLFKEPPYFGASFIDWERPGGKIHVSPYVWNVAAPKCPGYDMVWIGKKPSGIYETYVDGLRYIEKNTVLHSTSKCNV